MGAISPSKMPKAKTIKRKDNPNDVTCYAEGGSVKGLWDNIHAKRKRISEGSGEKMRRKGAKGAPTQEALLKSQTSRSSKNRKT
jgi:hypothetical protein